MYKLKTAETNESRWVHFQTKNEDLPAVKHGFSQLQQIESSLKYILGVDTQLIHDQTYYVIENGDTIVACRGWIKRTTLYGGDQYKAHATHCSTRLLMLQGYGPSLCTQIGHDRVLEVC